MIEDARSCFTYKSKCFCEQTLLPKKEGSTDEFIVPVELNENLRERKPHEYLLKKSLYQRIDRFVDWLASREEERILLVGHGKSISHDICTQSLCCMPTETLSSDSDEKSRKSLSNALGCKCRTTFQSYAQDRMEDGQCASLPSHLRP